MKPETEPRRTESIREEAGRDLTESTRNIDGERNGIRTEENRSSAQGRGRNEEEDLASSGSGRKYRGTENRWGKENGPDAATWQEEKKDLGAFW